MTLTFPQAPRFIPDSRISRVRLATMAFLKQPSQYRGSLSAGSHPPLTAVVYCLARDGILLSNLFRYCALGWFPSNTAMCREPLCPKPGVTCFWHDALHHVRWRYPSFIAHTGSCARPNSSCCLRFNYYNRFLQVVTSPCWKMALPDIISAILA